MTVNDFFRLPRITDSYNIEWVYSLSLCKFLKTLGGDKVTLPQILDILLQRLAQMPPADRRTTIDQQVILACQAFATSTIFATNNLHNLRVRLWNTLNLYHPSGLDYGDFLQMSLLLISEPHKKLNEPLHLFQGFNPQLCNEWHTPIAVLQAGQHPLQIWLKKKHQLSLIDYVREQPGSEDFRRTNYGLLKRTSAIKLGEALTRAGLLPSTVLLILQRALQDVVAQKKFHTANPQLSDYQQLHLVYQKYLTSKNEVVCSLPETIDRLNLVGNCLRNYTNSRIQSLNEVILEDGDELLDRLSNDHYLDPINAFIDLEYQIESQRLKVKICQQIMRLSVNQLAMLCLYSLGYNDSQIAVYQEVSASTIKRRRTRIFQNFLEINLDSPLVMGVCLDIVQDYFIVEIVKIRNQLVDHAKCSHISMSKVVQSINIKFNIQLVFDDRLKLALEKLFQKEGVA